MESERGLLSQVAQGESGTREFKRALDNPESVAGEIVAFANSEGGALWIGVEDNGEIIGVESTDNVFQSLTNICRDRCIPPVSPVLEQHNIGDKQVLLLEVRPELKRMKPYRTAEGRFYLRVGRDKKDATGRELVRISQAAGE
ncbi:MAG: ATP-binding protein [Armatimonadetes bacterium]|nr:ATP-binding protein [Armatimonadota bacterium]